MNEITPLPFSGANVRQAGARGDGSGDDSVVFNKLIREGASPLVVPPGEYACAHPIRPRSGTRILAHPSACIRLADGAELGVGDALVTNAEWEKGNEGIIRTAFTSAASARTA